MKREIISSVMRTFIFLALLLCFPNFIISQCTDADSDGYYYEEGCGTLRDCNDADSDIYPGATEICNGFDDDCDASLDETCDTCDHYAVWESDIRITEDPRVAEEPSLVWTGAEYGVTWHYWQDIFPDQTYFARLDSSGNKIGSEVLVPDNDHISRGPSIVWTGSQFGIAYSDDRESGMLRMYFSRFDSAGNKIGSDSRVSSRFSIFSGWSSLTWSGSEYGVAFADYQGGTPQDIFLARFDSSGSKIGSDDERISYSHCYSRYPSLVWAGSEFGAAWDDCPEGHFEIYFARIDASGNKIGSEVRVTYNSESSGYPSLAWTGSEYGVSWLDTRDGDYEIYFARLDSSGNKIGSDVRVTWEGSVAYGRPSLAWAGNEYGISWDDVRNGNSEIYFARLDSSGNKIDSDLRVTYDSSASPWMSLVWTGYEYAVVWVDWRDSTAQLYFNRIRCCEEDIPTPGATTGFFFETDKETMNWDSLIEADRYDVMKGDLMELRSSGGDFSTSLMECLEGDSLDTQSDDSNDPGSGEGFYYIVRAQYDCKTGTCNTGQAGQVGDRDSEVGESPNKCL